MAELSGREPHFIVTEPVETTQGKPKASRPLNKAGSAATASLLDVFRRPPEGLRWANGGGIGHIGGCNGLHLARIDQSGTLCGLYGPHTLADPRIDSEMCGNCERIAKARHLL